MPTARKTRRLLVLGVLVGVSAVAFAVWPRGPQLEWYTSPPFQCAGEQLRWKVLVPEGWTVRRCDISLDGRTVLRHPTSKGILLMPHEFDWVRAWASRLGLVFSGDDTLEVGYNDVFLAFPGTRVAQWGIGRVALSSGNTAGTMYVRYARTNRAEFESTYRQICESFHVLR